MTHEGVPTAQIEAFLRLPQFAEPVNAPASEEAPPDDLTGDWIGAFAQSVFGPSIVTSCTVTFDGTQARFSDVRSTARPMSAPVSRKTRGRARSAECWRSCRSRRLPWCPGWRS